MEGTMSEIRLFAGNFAPLSWRYCDGSLLSIAENTALFALIGTIYGGDGQVTFALPDLRGRIPVGVGQGQGLSYYEEGEMTGQENVTLITTQLPVHTHVPTVTAGSGSYSADANLFGVNTVGNQLSPSGNLLASASGSAQYASSGTPTPMKSASLKLRNISVANPNIAVSATGGSQPHNNIQPSLVLNYIICVEGIFPSRN